MNERMLLGKKILFVTAHPDDESFLAAGTIHKNNRYGGVSYIACATYGEKGKQHVGHLTAAKLREVRKRELHRVSHYLGVKELFCLRLPDGGLTGCGDRMKSKIAKLLAKVKPDVVVSFGSDGVTGHFDHIAIGRIAKQLALRLGLPFIQFIAPPLYVKYFEKTKLRRKFGRYRLKLRHDFFNVAIKIDPAVKEQALCFHKSQSENGNPLHGLPASVCRQWLSREYFKRIP